MLSINIATFRGDSWLLSIPNYSEYKNRLQRQLQQQYIDIGFSFGQLHFVVKGFCVD